MHSVSDIESLAHALPRAARLKLAGILVASAAGADAMTPEDILSEVMRRDEELENGSVKALTEEEFWSGVRRPGQPE